MEPLFDPNSNHIEIRFVSFVEPTQNIPITHIIISWRILEIPLSHNLQNKSLMGPIEILLKTLQSTNMISKENVAPPQLWPNFLGCDQWFDRKVEN